MRSPTPGTKCPRSGPVRQDTPAVNWHLPVMPEAPCKFFLTTPIYYVNARPHIGHAYTTIVADVLARRSRAQGNDTWFLTGTDEHGQKIERSAAAAGIPPQQFADNVSAEFRALWKRMGLTNNDFIRTTEGRHKRGVQKLWRELESRGHIYLSSYTGQYCVSEEIFVEGPPGTIGPDGRPTETVTEENYFFRLSAFQRPLIDLLESNQLEVRPEARKNELLSFLRGNVSGVTNPGAPSTSDSLIVGQGRSRHPSSTGGLGGGVASEAGPSFSTREQADSSPIPLPSSLPMGPSDIPGTTIQEPAPEDSAPSAPALAYSAQGNPYVPGALRDLSISRSSFTWGIPVPDNPKHVIYVWLDALTNYMTAVGYGSDDAADQAKFERYWPADLQLVGKEIIRQHCIYWPAFLLAAELPLPKKVVAHGWLLFEESKMSKSRGNIVRSETILDAFGQEVYAKQFPESTKHEQDLFAADVLRYFLLREIPFGQDGSFSFDAMITRYNADLANGYGNLVSRTLGLILQNFSPIELLSSPKGTARIPPLSKGNDTDAAIYSNRLSAHAKTLIETQQEEGHATQIPSVQHISDFIQKVDVFISEEKPWKIASARREFVSLDSPNPNAQKEAEDRLDAEHLRLEKILYTAAESIRIITALLYPILPYATASVWRQLGLGDIEAAAQRGELTNLQWGGLKPGTKLGALAPIFPRADKGLAQIMANLEQEASDKKNALAGQTDAADAATASRSEFAEAPIASATPASGDAALAAESATYDPAAGPRTATLAEPNPGAQVGGSSSPTAVLPPPGHHTEAAASGIFAGQPADASPQITIDDFAKVELRVAKVLVAERIPKADKLLRLEVDLGYERRQILSGIAEWYTPEDLLGRRIVVITNLAPRKMRGLESHGMLLAASAPEGGKPALATFQDTDDLPLGSRLK